MRLVVIGGVAAGTKAASKARRVDLDLEIIIYQEVGGNADKYVDICATAIWGKLSYPDLVNLDLAYAPPFGPTLSPVIGAASVLANEFERETEGVRAIE